MNHNIPVQTQVTSTVIDSEIDSLRSVNQESKSGILKLLSFLLLLLSLIYGLSSVIVLWLIFSISIQYSSIFGFEFTVLRDIPQMGISVIVYSITSLLLFYVSRKVAGGSKKGFWVSILFILVISVPSQIINAMILRSFFYDYFLMADIGADTGTPTPLPQYLPLPLVIMNVLILIITVFSYKKFSHPETPLGIKSKSLLIFYLVITISMMIALGSAYLKSQDKDDGYNTIQSQVSYHLYKPAQIPSGRVVKSKFMIGSKIGDIENPVWIIYGYDIKGETDLKAKIGFEITFRQINVPVDFNIDNFISRHYPTSGSSKITAITLSKYGKGYYIETTISKSIFFIAPGNVLIQIISMRSSKEELLSFAESLL